MSQIVYPGYDPGDPDTMFLPDYFVAERARRMGVPAYRLLSPEYAATIHAVDGIAEAGDLSYRLGGRASKPVREVVLIGADGRTPVVIPGAGVTEAAELEEIALEVYERQVKKLRAGRPLVDFDAMREREGRPLRAEFDPLFRQALRDRIARHRARPRTDPERVPIPPRGLFPAANSQEVASDDDQG